MKPLIASAIIVALCMPAMARERPPVEKWNVTIDILVVPLGVGQACKLKYDQAAVDRVIRKFIAEEDRAELEEKIEEERKEISHVIEEEGTDNPFVELLCKDARDLASQTLGFLPSPYVRGPRELCWRVADCVDSGPGGPLQR
jgi:hypothetical protein